MTIVVPIDNKFSSFSQEVILDEIPFRFLFTFNNRFEFWSLEIQNREEATLIGSIRLVLNFGLTDQYPDRDLPPGQLYCIDTTEKEITVERFNIGQNEDGTEAPVQMLYIPENEV